MLQDATCCANQTGHCWTGRHRHYCNWCTSASSVHRIQLSLREHLHLTIRILSRSWKKLDTTQILVEEKKLKISKELLDQYAYPVGLNTMEQTKPYRQHLQNLISLQSSLSFTHETIYRSTQYHIVLSVSIFFCIFEYQDTNYRHTSRVCHMTYWLCPHQCPSKETSQVTIPITNSFSH